MAVDVAIVAVAVVVELVVVVDLLLDDVVIIAEAVVEAAATTGGESMRMAWRTLASMSLRVTCTRLARTVRVRLSGRLQLSLL